MADKDEHWITTKTGSHILVDGDGNVKGGAGGALDGKKLGDVSSGGKNKIDMAGGGYVIQKADTSRLESKLKSINETISYIEKEGRDAPLMKKERDDLIKKIEKEKKLSEKKSTAKFPKKIRMSGGSYFDDAKRVADSIEAASNGSLVAHVEKSSMSESTYLMLTTKDGEEGKKIRISDHEDRYGGNDVYFSPKNEDSSIFYKRLSDVLKNLGAENFEKMIPDMNKEVTNAKQLPAVFYAKHMESGHATYENETILLDNPMLIKMAQSFVGKPVFAESHQKVDIDNLQEQSDGYVTDSFYNELDGWLWVKFIAVSDAAFECIAKGYGVSNAYVPIEHSGAGTHHNTPYDRKITDAYFTHLAIVENPRYEESKILTPEEFKAYQAAAKSKIDEITNSKPKEEPKMFKMFKTKKEELTSIDPEACIELEDGKSVSIQEMLNAVKKNEAEEKEEDKKEEKFNMDDEIDVDGEKMPLKELVSRYQNMCKKNSDDADEDDKSKEDKSKENEGDSDKEEDKKEDDEKTNSVDFFAELKNAHKSAATVSVESSMDKVARGQSRYGSTQ